MSDETTLPTTPATPAAGEKTNVTTMPGPAPSANGATAPVPASALPGAPLESITLDVYAQPTPPQLIKTMALTAKLLNRQAGLILASGGLTAAHPAIGAMCNAAAQLETGAMQFDQILKQMAQQMHAQAGLAMPGMVPPRGLN